MSELLEMTVDETQAGLRLDVFLAEMVEDATRSFLKKVVQDGRVTVNSHVCKKPSRVMAAGEVVAVDLPDPSPAEPQPEDIPLDILFQDDDVVVVNKPAGLVVHPAPGHDHGTLVNALLFHCPGFQRAGADQNRPGIVHRLDRDTSGVMVAAKTRRAFISLAEQAAAHTFDRRYLALVRGEFPEDRARIDAPLGRSLADPSKMAVTGLYAREAVTHVEVLERFGAASLVRLRLETGRTHQIRVHMRFAGRPILGDPVYGVSDFRGMGLPEDTTAALNGLRGQALHAGLLGFTHPATGKRLQFEAGPPEDFTRALDALRALAGAK